jgi:hypothetical protein
MTNPQTYAARIRAIWTKPGWTMYDFIRDINALAAEADAKLAEAEKRIGELEGAMEDELIDAFAAGFDISAEGCNAEYGSIGHVPGRAMTYAKKRLAALASRPGKEEGGK